MPALVVDADPLRAIDMAYMLSDAGYRVLGPALTIEMALTVLATTQPTVGILKILIDGRPVCPVAQVLLRRRVPFLLLNQWRPEDLPRGEPIDAPILTEPVGGPDLLHALDALTAKSMMLRS